MINFCSNGPKPPASYVKIPNICANTAHILMLRFKGICGAQVKMGTVETPYVMVEVSFFVSQIPDVAKQT